jgi:hypothetical protein
MSDQHVGARSTVDGNPWKDLFQVGAISCFVQLLLVVLAVVAFLIWSYAPGQLSAREIFQLIGKSRLAGIMALDVFFFVVANLLNLPIMLAVFMAVKRVNPSYALIALVVGLVGAAALISSRPIAELLALSDRYASAATALEQSQHLAAGEALAALFDGTAWMLSIYLVAISFFISSWLMLAGGVFSKATAWVGIGINMASLGGPLPVVGASLLLVTTFGGMLFLWLLGLGLLKLAREDQVRRR